MSRIFLDTNFFIYLIQGTGPQSVRTKYLRNAFSVRRDEILTSVITLGELLVEPMRAGDYSLVQRYKQILRSPGITVLPFLESAAEAFASIRRDKVSSRRMQSNLLTPQLLAATYFLPTTNDS